MKKILAILFLTIIFASGIQVSIYHHYCGGKLAETKVSLSGKLASCGMEENGRTCSNQPFIDKNCCEDQITYLGINAEFVPEYFKLSYPSTGKSISSCTLFNVTLNYSYTINSASWVLPPGDKMKSGLPLSHICVLRI